VDAATTGILRIAVGADAPEGWLSFDGSHEVTATFVPSGPTPADDLNLLYFTSGTTSATPKLVRHTHVSYPVGHLSTSGGWGCAPATST
jgi:acetyl-CoA synthetase